MFCVIKDEMSYHDRHYRNNCFPYIERIPYGDLKSKALKAERTLHIIGKTGLALSLAGGAGFGLGVGIRALIGSYGKQFPQAEAQKLNMKKYTSAFQATSPAGKFVMQYLKHINIDHIEYPDAHGLTAGRVEAYVVGNGAYWQTSVGNACLNNTAYDIAGGTIDFNLTYDGLFSYGNASANGNIPTAAAYAEISPENHNDLIVQSGNNNSIELTFSGLEDRTAHALTPANEQTKNILATYGCSIQPITSEVLNPNPS